MAGASIAGEQVRAPIIKAAWARLWPYAAVVALTGAAFTWLWFANAPWVFPLDDSYITQHNALSVLAGADADFGGPAIGGATSLAHLALVVAAVVALPRDPILGQFIVSALGAVAYLCGVVALARQAEAPFLKSCAALFAAVTIGFASYHLISGQEPGWALAAVTWAFWFAGRAPSRALAATCGLMPFLRPELAALSGLLLARQAWLRRDLRATVLDAAIAVAVAAPFIGWSVAELGSIVPNTIAAKAAYFAGSWHANYALGMVARTLFLVLGPLLGALILAPRSSLKYAALAFIAIFLAVYALAAPWCLGWNVERYDVILLPVGVWAFLQIARRPQLGAAFAAVLVVWGAATIQPTEREFNYGVAQERDGLVAAQWLDAHVPADTPVMVHDDGAIAMGGPHRLIDVVGLLTPWVVPIHQALNLPSHGVEHGAAIARIATLSRARYLVDLNDVQNFWNQIPADLRAHGWKTVVVRRAHAGTGGYTIFALTAPRGVRPQ